MRHSDSWFEASITTSRTLFEGVADDQLLGLLGALAAADGVGDIGGGHGDALE